MIRLPANHREFPRAHGAEVPANAWGSQWRTLRADDNRGLVRFGNGLRIMPIR